MVFSTVSLFCCQISNLLFLSKCLSLRCWLTLLVYSSMSVVAVAPPLSDLVVTFSPHFGNWFIALYHFQKGYFFEKFSCLARYIQADRQIDRQTDRQCKKWFAWEQCKNIGKDMKAIWRVVSAHTSASSLQVVKKVLLFEGR